MKKISGLFMAIAMLMAFNTQAQGIKFFDGSTAELKAEAKKQNKLIFIDCYTTWCGPCKMLAKNIFPLKEVGEFYNSHFICYSLDMEKGEGPDVKKQFNIEGYPTCLYLNADGEMVHRTGGAGEAKRFIKDGENAISPNDNLVALQKNYKNGNRDTALLKKLIIANKSAMLPQDTNLSNAYWKAVPMEDLLKIQCLVLFINTVEDINSAQYKYVYANKEKLYSKYPKQTIDFAIYDKAAIAINLAAENNDSKLFEHAKAIVSETDDASIVEEAQFGELSYYKSSGQWDNYLAVADIISAKRKNNYIFYNAIAWNIVSNVENKSLLDRALAYSLKSISDKKEYSNMDTYAYVKFKQGNLDEARAAALEAIELAKKEGKSDCVSSRALLEKIDKVPKK